MNHPKLTRSARALALSLATSGWLLCGLAPAQAQPANAPIRIGIITDEVGPAKAYAEPVTLGAQFAAKEINAAGGVLGRQIELQIEDDQGKPDVSATMARKLVDANAVIILSLSLSTATQQAQTVTLETKTPHYTPSNSGDTLTTQLNNPWFFQSGPLGSTQVATLLSYARAMKLKRVALITETSALGQLTNRFFKEGLIRNGIEVVAEEVVPGGASTAEPQMQKIRAAKPDAIFLAGVVTPENVLMLRAYRQLGLKMPILASYNLSVPVYMNVAKGLLDGLAYVDAFDPAKPELQKFIAAWRKDHAEDPNGLHGYGYDGVYLVADALRRAGAVDKEKLRAAMQSTRGFNGVMGAKGSSYTFPEGKRTGFDESGMVVRIYEGDRQGKVVHVGTN